jgi:hypothetical protein
MALEGSDINDGDILTATKQATDTSGKMQFSIILPLGKKLTSEWFPQEDGRKAIMAWVEAVRQAALDEQAEAMAAARRNSRAPVVDSVQRPEQGGGMPGQPHEITWNGTPKIEETDGLAFANTQVQALENRVEELNGEYEAIGAKLTAARSRLAQWRVIKSQLENGKNASDS